MTTKKQKQESRKRLEARRERLDREATQRMEARKKHHKAFAVFVLFTLAILSGILILGIV